MASFEGKTRTHWQGMGSAAGTGGTARMGGTAGMGGAGGDMPVCAPGTADALPLMKFAEVVGGLTRPTFVAGAPAETTIGLISTRS